MNENWSIKLQVGGGGVPLYNEWELVYKSAQTGYKLTQGKASITGQEPLVITHQSDNASPVLARAIEQNKTLSFEISILDNVNAAASFDWDTALNNVHTLARHLSGAASTAVRASSGGQNVRIAIKPDTATYTTYYDVQWGTVDTSASYYLAESQQGSTQVGTKGAWWIPVTLVLKEGGYGDAFTLRNDLASSPHFIEDSNADGLADGWSLTGTPPSTYSISTSRYITGGKSQQLYAAAATAGELGIYSAPVTANISTTAAAYVWIAIDAGSTGTVTARLVDGSFGLIQAKSITYANRTAASKSYTGSNGQTWSRLDLSGTNAAAANFRLVIIRDNALLAATFYIDCAYLQTGTLTVPPAFSSSSSLKNRYDPTSTSAATQQQINYLDVWGVPGDLPALMDIADTLGATSPETFNFSRWIDMQNNANDYYYWLESQQTGWSVSSTATTNGSWASSSDAKYSDGTAYQFTAAGGVGSSTMTLSNLDDDAPNFFYKNRRVHLAVSTSNVLSTVSVEVEARDFFSNAIVDLISSEAKTLPATGPVYLLDMGLLNSSSLAEYDDLPFTPSISIRVKVSVANVPNGATIAVDAFYLPLVTEEYFTIQKDSGVPTSGGVGFLNTISKDKIVTTSLSPISEAGVLGSFWNLQPATMNRLVFVMLETDGDLALTNTNKISLTITPRTSHLLGTA